MGRSRLRQADAQSGKLSFGVQGTAATPPSARTGQVRIEAGVGGPASASARVVVVVPKRISPLSRISFNNDVTPQNLILHKGTSPRWKVENGQVALVTAWYVFLPLSVNDQFGNGIDGLYNGVRVEERLGDDWNFINQTLVSGFYENPVGYTQPIPAQQVPSTSAAAQNWGTSPRLPMGEKVIIEQNIPVRIGGHQIDNIRRTLTATPPNHIQIRWK